MFSFIKRYCPRCGKDNIDAGSQNKYCDDCWEKINPFPSWQPRVTRLSESDVDRYCSLTGIGYKACWCDSCKERRAEEKRAEKEKNSSIDLDLAKFWLKD